MHGFSFFQPIWRFSHCWFSRLHPNHHLSLEHTHTHILAYLLHQLFFKNSLLSIFVSNFFHLFSSSTFCIIRAILCQEQFLVFKRVCVAMLGINFCFICFVKWRHVFHLKLFFSICWLDEKCDFRFWMNIRKVWFSNLIVCCWIFYQVYNCEGIWQEEKQHVRVLVLLFIGVLLSLSLSL